MFHDQSTSDPSKALSLSRESLPSNFINRRQRIFSIIAISTGNLVEWFDFYIYSFCALYFAPLFFPEGDFTSQLLKTAGIFAAGFFMRPLGAWFFGRLADRQGRRPATVLSVSLMGAGSLLIRAVYQILYKK